MKLVVCLIILSMPAVGQMKWDVSLFRTINNTSSPETDKFFPFLTNSMRPVVISAPIGFFATGVLAKDRQAEDTGVLLAGATILNLGLTYAMKEGFHRKRPFETLENVHYKGGERSPSFPSGHSSSAFATATLVSLQYKKWYIAVPAYTWASLVGYSRVHGGYHYPSDVLAGAIVGAGCAYLLWKIRAPILKFKDKVLH